MACGLDSKGFGRITRKNGIVLEKCLYTCFPASSSLVPPQPFELASFQSQFWQPKYRVTDEQRCQVCH